MLKDDIGAWSSPIPSKMKSRESSVAHSISPSMMLSFNTSKVIYFITSVAHSGMPSQIYPSLPKFLSAHHLDMPSQIYSSLPKHYP